MNFSYLQRSFTIIAIGFLGACGSGGGGGDSSSPTPPMAQEVVSNDAITIIENTPSTANVLANDSGISPTSLAINQPPANGTATISGTAILYTPNSGFRGTDQLTYSVSANSGANLTASLSITVNAITDTTLTVQTLNIPTSGFQNSNNAELGATILESPNITFSVPPNTVSVVAALTGTDVNNNGTNLFIASLINADGVQLTPLQRNVAFCDPGYCSALVPKRPDQALPAGDWQLTIGTLASDLSSTNVDDLSLRVSARVGPEPSSTVLQIRAFLTAPSISTTELDLVLQELVLLGQQSNISIQLDPIESVNDAQFNEVSRSFTDATTRSLIELGAVNRVNLFFIEDFSGAGGAGLLGVSGGLPGSLGQQSAFNGVLINATANRSLNDAAYARTTAEVAFHEMGHFLGLYHTTERQFDLHDVLDDTPECLSSDDRSSVGVSGVADIDECPDGQNPMFWNTDLSGNKISLSSDQQTVIRASPIAVPTR